MNYFSDLANLLRMEKEEDRRSYQSMIETLPVVERRASGVTWYPIAIRDTELGHADYLTVEVERTTHQEIIHQLRFGMSAALFSNHDAINHRINGTISHISGNRLKITLRTDELPEWSTNGKLGIDAVFDENSYAEMEKALSAAPALAEKKHEGELIRILTGQNKPTFRSPDAAAYASHLNTSQKKAVENILSANELAIVHGPPGTGKTTTLVESVRLLVQQQHQQVLVTAPSNAAVDLLSEKLSDKGLNVLRIGNPARVSTRQLSLTLDSRMTAHPSMKQIRRMKKQASEFRDMAQKYKRSFGPAEREQRKALFAEARKINKEADATEQYIIEDLISRADVITATLVGANHYTVRHLTYHTAVIDEAGQSIEPACWIPVLKAKKIILAGDHCQLPPTIKSAEAAKKGLNITLMEKLVKTHPESVVLLEEQYRMHKNIMHFPSQHFYEGKLKAHPTVAEHLLFPGDAPLQFIDTAGCGFEEKQEGTSTSNPEEAALLIKRLTALIKTCESLPGITLPSIAIVSPYKHQVEILKDLLLGSTDLAPHHDIIAVNTIDSFQGQERDAVFISMTRSNADQTIGFLADIRRMNVAMTRARKKLVVLGDSATLSQFGFYANFINYTQEINAYKSAWEFMEW